MRIVVLLVVIVCVCSTLGWGQVKAKQTLPARQRIALEKVDTTPFCFTFNNLADAYPRQFTKRNVDSLQFCFPQYQIQPVLKRLRAIENALKTLEDEGYWEIEESPATKEADQEYVRLRKWIGY